MVAAVLSWSVGTYCMHPWGSTSIAKVLFFQVLTQGGATTPSLLSSTSLLVLPRAVLPFNVLPELLIIRIPNVPLVTVLFCTMVLSANRILMPKAAPSMVLPRRISLPPPAEMPIPAPDMLLPCTVLRPLLSKLTGSLISDELSLLPPEARKPTPTRSLSWMFMV